MLPPSLPCFQTAEEDSEGGEPSPNTWPKVPSLPHRVAPASPLPTLGLDFLIWEVGVMS